VPPHGDALDSPPSMGPCAVREDGEALVTLTPHSRAGVPPGPSLPDPECASPCCLHTQVGSSQPPLCMVAKHGDDHLLNSSLSPVVSFADVPKCILQPTDWKVLHVGSLRRREHITRSEGRALVWGVCHSHRSASRHPQRQLYLVDNMAMCLSVKKGRSGSPLLRGTLEFIAAVSIASGDLIVTR
jgi:hypothetical protein